MKYSAYDILRLALAAVAFALAAAVAFYVLPFWIAAVAFTIVVSFALVGRPISAFFVASGFALLALSGPSFAQDAVNAVNLAFPSPAEVGPPLIAAPSWVPALFYPYWNYIGSAGFILYALAHARAWVPTTGSWSIVGAIWDLLAGNYKLATNASKST